MKSNPHFPSPCEKLKYFPKDKGELLELLEDESIKLDEIDVSQIKDMSQLFCQSIELMRYPVFAIVYEREIDSTRKDFSGIESWDVSNVEDMSEMFQGNKDFNQPIGSWNVSNVKNMKNMFYEATSFNQDLSSWGEKNPFKDNEGKNPFYKK